MKALAIIAAFAIFSLTGAAQAGHRPRHWNGDAQYVAYHVLTRRHAVEQPPAQMPREDFGSSSARNVAHTLGYN